MMPMRSSMNSAVFCATSFFSSLASWLQNDTRRLMKSTPRRLTVFLKDTLAIVVVLDEGVTLNSLP